MPATYKRNALGRIGIIINTYIPQIPKNPDLSIENDRLNAYLKVHLLSQDWIFWQQLHRDEQDLLIHTLAVEQAKLSSARAIDRLFSQYKRAGIELIKGWDQAKGKSFFDR